MKNIENSGKIIGLLIATVYLLFFQSNPAFEWVLIVTVLVTVGIPHGSLDHLLSNPNLNLRGLIRFIGKYIAIILIYLFIWIFLPVPALIMFLGMSAYHFGQSHFINLPLTYQKEITYFSTGIFYLSVILWGDFSQTTLILSTIAPMGNLEDYGWPVIFISFFSSAYLIPRNQPKRGFPMLMEMLFVGTIFYYLPLLVGFILYFGFWHSLPSMHAAYRSLRQHFFKKPLKTFIGKMIPFTAVSIGGIAVILLILYPRNETEDLVLLFFIIISLISAPHIWFMDRFLEAKK